MDFERGKEPKTAIGVGLFSPKYFTDFQELRVWLLQNFTKILDLDHLPDPRLSTDQWKEIRKYVEKYLFLET